MNTVGPSSWKHTQAHVKRVRLQNLTGLTSSVQRRGLRSYPWSQHKWKAGGDDGT